MVTSRTKTGGRTGSLSEASTRVAVIPASNSDRDPRLLGADALLAGVVWSRRTVTCHDAVERLRRVRRLESPAAWCRSSVQAWETRVLARGNSSSGIRDTLLDSVETLADTGMGHGCFTVSAQRQAFAQSLATALATQQLTFSPALYAELSHRGTGHATPAVVAATPSKLSDVLGLCGVHALSRMRGASMGVSLGRLPAKGESVEGGVAGGVLPYARALEALGESVLPDAGMGDACLYLPVDHPDVAAFAADVPVGRGVARCLRLSDSFMTQALAGRPWVTRWRGTGDPARVQSAEGLLDGIVEACRASAGFQIQFSNAVERGNMCPADGPLAAGDAHGSLLSHPGTAAPTAGVDVSRFVVLNGGLDVRNLRRAVATGVIALNLALERALAGDTPMAVQLYAYRPILLEICGLESALRSAGHVPGTAAARGWAACVAALVTGEALRVSADLARRFGAFGRFDENAAVIDGILRTQRGAIDAIDVNHAPPGLLARAMHLWDEVLAMVARHGLRNAHLTGMGAGTELPALLGHPAKAAANALPSVSMARALQPFMVGGGCVAEVAFDADIRSEIIEAWRSGLKTVVVGRRASPL